MAKSPNQKLKLVYICKILLEKTDENHPLTVRELINELLKYDITAERKSIYDDINLLRDVLGLDIVCEKKKHFGYYIASRQFEIAELKLLVDSVQSAKFVTERKSLSLISKIEKLAGMHDARLLHRDVYIANRAKTGNESIYYNVDRIHDAVAKNRQITFRYFEWTVNKTKHYRKDGQLYRETPIALMRDDENYYLISYKKKYDSYTHYRVDKMDGISIAEEERVMPETPFDPAAYSKKVFSIFSGTDESVTAEFDTSLAGVVIDRFGTGIIMTDIGGGRFSAVMNVSVSNQFFSWVFGLGSRVKIISPETVVKKYKDYLNGIIKIYE